MADESEVLADEADLRESILRQIARIPKAFEHFDAGMLIYEGVLNESQVKALVLFIQSLSGDETAEAK